MKSRRRRTFRRTSFGYKLKGVQPKFISGDTAGEFIIETYIRYTSVNPVTGVPLSREHHWYKCKCSCGVIEIHTQQQLSDTRRLRVCKECRPNALNTKTEDL